MIDHRYRYWNRKEFEIAEKSGMKWSDAVQAARDKCQPLRDPTKVASASLPDDLHHKIYQLETLRFDNILTPEEADELEELHRRYPDRAEKTREGVVQRLSYDQDTGRPGVGQATILGLSKKTDGPGFGPDLLGCRKDSCQLMAAAAAQRAPVSQSMNSIGPLGARAIVVWRR
jgi:hypothetical protein